MSIGQQKFINKLLCEWKMENCKNMATPLEAGFQVKCDKENCEEVDAKKYQSLIGSLMYLALSTRPDIMHSVVKLAQRNVNPHKEHEIGAKRVLRYLKGTSDYKIHYEKTGKPVYGYVDADWAGDATNRKSYTGFTFIAAGGSIAWESKKQSVVALSSTEAEYIALTSAAKEAIYIRKILKEISLEDRAPTLIYSDNQSAQCLAKNPTNHSRSKHIDIRYHFVREAYNNKEIEIKYIATEDMTADVLTKNLQKIKHAKCITEMKLF